MSGFLSGAEPISGMFGICYSFKAIVSIGSAQQKVGELLVAAMGPEIFSPSFYVFPNVSVCNTQCMVYLRFTYMSYLSLNDPNV